MKKILILMIVLISCFAIIGCTSTKGSFSTVMSVENNTIDSMSMKYKKFNGYKSKTFTINEGETYVFSFDIVSEKGKLDMTLANEDGKIFYQGKSIQTSNFTVTVDEVGKYTLKIEAKNHKGSYDIKWQK